MEMNPTTIQRMDRETTVGLRLNGSRSDRVSAEVLDLPSGSAPPRSHALPNPTMARKRRRISTTSVTTAAATTSTTTITTLFYPARSTSVANDQTGRSKSTVRRTNARCNINPSSSSLGRNQRRWSTKKSVPYGSSSYSHIVGSKNNSQNHQDVKSQAHVTGAGISGKRGRAKTRFEKLREETDRKRKRRQAMWQLVLWLYTIVLNVWILRYHNNNSSLIVRKIQIRALYTSIRLYNQIRKWTMRMHYHLQDSMPPLIPTFESSFSSNHNGEYEASTISTSTDNIMWEMKNEEHRQTFKGLRLNPSYNIESPLPTLNSGTREASPADPLHYQLRRPRQQYQHQQQNPHQQEQEHGMRPFLSSATTTTTAVSAIAAYVRGGLLDDEVADYN